MWPLVAIIALVLALTSCGDVVSPSPLAEAGLTPDQIEEVLDRACESINEFRDASQETWDRQKDLMAHIMAAGLTEGPRESFFHAEFDNDLANASVYWIINQCTQAGGEGSGSRGRVQQGVYGSSANL